MIEEQTPEAEWEATVALEMKTRMRARAKAFAASTVAFALSLGVSGFVLNATLFNAGRLRSNEYDVVGGVMKMLVTWGAPVIAVAFPFFVATIVYRRTRGKG